MPDAYPIIPLFGTAKAEVALPKWPRISQVRFEILQTRIAERFDAVAPRLLAQNVTGPLYFLLLLAVRPFPWGIGLIRNKALDFVKAFMLADLVRRDLIEGWELPPNPGLDGDDIRLVLHKPGQFSQREIGRRPVPGDLTRAFVPHPMGDDPALRVASNVRVNHRGPQRLTGIVDQETPVHHAAQSHRRQFTLCCGMRVQKLPRPLTYGTPPVIRALLGVTPRGVSCRIGRDRSSQKLSIRSVK